MKKKFLIILGTILLFISLVGLWGYTKYLRPDLEIQQQLNNQFGAEFFDVVNNSGVVNNVKLFDDSENKIDISVSGSIQKKVKEQDESNETTTTPANENIATKSISLDDINTKYSPQFNNLQNMALSRLETLYSAAIQEYVQGTQAGTLNRSELARKYIQAGSMLETTVDGQFNSTLNEMKAELISNNLPTDIVGLIKNEYEKAKSNKRSQLLTKALK